VERKQIFRKAVIDRMSSPEQLTDYIQGGFTSGMLLAFQGYLAQLTDDIRDMPMGMHTIKQATRIIVLDGGRIAEDGTYDVLMEQNGIFAALVRRQMVTKNEEVSAS
jgi:predicted ester cyclase